MLMKIDLDQLRDDGDTLKLQDGRSLRLRVEHDQDYDPFDSDVDFYGKIAVVRVDPYDDYGYPRRPREFNGNAEKIWTYNRGEQLWWQPPKDGPKRSDPEFVKFREQVRDLASFGGYGVVLELLEGQDAYHRPIVRQVADLWGIDSLDNGYLAEVVKELADELGLLQTEHNPSTMETLDTQLQDWETRRWESGINGPGRDAEAYV